MPIGQALEFEVVLSAGNRFEFTLVAPPLVAYRIEQSSELRVWTRVQTFTASHPVTELSFSFPGSGGCFYRAVRL